MRPERCGELNSNFIIVFNDNQMSIAENHGGMYDQFAELHRTNGAAENNTLQIDGSGLRSMSTTATATSSTIATVFEQVKRSSSRGPHQYAQEQGIRSAGKQEKWHWHMPFDIRLVRVLRPVPPVVRQHLYPVHAQKRAKDDPKFLVLMSAVPALFGLSQNVRKA